MLLALDGYSLKLNPGGSYRGIEAVAMDMWDPYVDSVRAHLADPDDKIVFDRFHIMGHMGQALDTVRKREHRLRLKAGDQSLVVPNTSGSTPKRTSPPGTGRAFGRSGMPT